MNIFWGDYKTTCKAIIITNAYADLIIIVIRIKLFNPRLIKIFFAAITLGNIFYILPY